MKSMEGPRLVALLVVVAMCGVSVYGATRLPAEARWPVRFGGLGFQTTLGRGTGLVLWPLTGGLIAAVAWMDDGAYGGLTLIGLLLMLWAQVTAVRRLARS